VRELSDVYAEFMVGPRPGPGVCTLCFNLTEGYSRCYACSRVEAWLDVAAPISYSIAGEQLHHILASYKRLSGVRRLAMELAAVLSRFLDEHEACIARAAGVPGFQLVATVPSGDRARDEWHPLRWMVDELVGPTRRRHERLLRRSQLSIDPRAFSPEKYAAARSLEGEPVLLIDDTWTTGANAQSAGAALKRAGAGRVAAVVIGRHLNREWHENDCRLRRLARAFEWERCALCASVAETLANGRDRIRPSASDRQFSGG
jgi:predicted amidophosphoribosyltransferase